MSKTAVRRRLAAYFALLWAGMVFRIDQFPLTWAPMYSEYSPDRLIGIRKVDKEEMKKGFVVTHRDGSQSRIGADELNVPKWNFYRLYYQRAFLSPPVKHRYGNASLDPLNRWVRGLEPGEKIFTADWKRRLFKSIHSTLGHAPDDPRFVVRIEAWFEQLFYDREALVLASRRIRHADLHWNPEWAAPAE